MILNYTASTVSVLPMAFSSSALSEAKIRDLALSSIRPQLSSIEGMVNHLKQQK
jgi:hypothetical protein